MEINELKNLPNLVKDPVKPKILKPKQGEGVNEYWERQAPHFLKYALEKTNSFIEKTERGEVDPLGAHIFKEVMSKTIKSIKVAKVEASKDVGLPIGRNAKAYAKTLRELQSKQVDDGEIVSMSEDEIKSLINDLPNLGDKMKGFK